MRSTSISVSRLEPVVCNTSPVRYFALVGQFDLLVKLLGGKVRVPRQVLDPDEDPDGIQSLASEIARSERYWARRSLDPEAMQNWDRLRRLRSRNDIDVVDLDDDELLAFAEMTGPSYAKSVGLAGVLGPGEAAVMADSENRGWTAAMDDALAREVLLRRSPGTGVVTTRELVRRAVAEDLVDRAEAQFLYDDMLARGYRGPPGLWG
jgi:predicted nucleic acid-binding protein